MHDPRTHLYRTIHRAVRLLLAELSALTGATDFASDRELSDLRARTARAFDMLGGHAHHEEEWVHPLLAKHAPEVRALLDDAHGSQHDTMPALLERLAAIDPRSPEAIDRADEYRIALSRYVAEQLQHMADEEARAMPALYAAMSDDELVALHDALVQSVPPAEMMAWLGYMLPGISGPERAGMLLGMRAGAPAEAFAAVMGIARQVLPGSAFEDLSARLAQAA